MNRLNFLLAFCVLLLTSCLANAQCAPCTVWPPTAVPTTVDGGESASIELGVKFRADSNGYVTGVRFYKAAANGGTHLGNLWTSGGVLLASAQFTSESSSGWQQVNFNTPVAVSAGTTYIASYFTAVGHYSYDPAFFASSGVDNPPLHALASGVDGSNGVYNYGSTSSFPGTASNATNYWVDVVYVPSGATIPPTVTATSPAAAAGGVPIILSVNATFSMAMNASTINSSTFQLIDPSNNVVPGTVTYSPATLTATFQPSSYLAYQTTYTAVVRGAVQNFLGNTLGSDFSWMFTTQNAPSSNLCPCSIWPATTVPGLQDGGDANAVELGVKFNADLAGYITGIRFFKASANTGTHIGNLWTTNGTLLGSATFSGESSSGWQQVIFTSPIAVTAGQTYIASYFTSAGHYSFSSSYFSANVDNAPLHALASGSSGGNGVYVYGANSAFPNATYNASNYWVDVVYVPQNSTTPPVILSTTPGNGTTGAALGAAVSATFDEPMDPATIVGSAFQLVDPSNNVVPGTVSYVPATASLVFQPSIGLTPQTLYTATVRGTVHDTFGNALGNDYTWSFTTALPPGDSGPGGPILVIASTVNPFSRYFGEILMAEGLNEFRVKDVTTVTSQVLSQYDIAILGDFPLTSSQASMLSTWVSGGGQLIAMHPDPQLAGILGLNPLGSTLSEGYMLVNTQVAPGAGIFGQPMQYHGTADLYALSGATALASLYSNATTATTSPALTLANAGAGQAAAFTYDLARSVVYTRQGNPAWSGQQRDPYIDPAINSTVIRPDDLFYGNASFDPEPDWVNFSLIQVPQADEQQRLLANLIETMNRTRKPLPRFWYLPSGFKAAIVMTGDDHGASGTGPRFDTYISESPANCSVADWTCVRATSYVFPANVTLPNYATYIAEGFELANHSDNDPTCSNFTAASLDASITASQARMTQYFPLAPPSQTNRTHCVLWSDYDTEPAVLLNHGIRLDTTYYYWPDLWVQGRPGLFTGSGMPMRYSDRNGNTFDIYQATTQFPDETTWNWPGDAVTVLNNALGAQGFYAVVTFNIHTDTALSYWSNDIVAAAQSLGVPVISSLQMLTWLDGRNNSSFSNVTWSGSTLSFTVSAASGAHNLEATVPLNAASGTVNRITLAGVPVSYSVQTIKGIQYAVFLATGGAYQAVYSGAATYSLSGSISGAGGNAATVTLSGAGNATTVADGSGNYTFTGLTNGVYTVTPSQTGHMFSPASQNATVSNANVTGINFTSTAVTYSITGVISGAGGNGATVTLSGAGTATTTADGSGNYTFTGLVNGVYTVTPAKTGYTFSPASQNATVSNANVTGVNFTTTAVTYSITGAISGAGGNAATATLSGAGNATTTADGSGNYTFTGLVNGVYTVTPAKTGFTFSPASQNATVSNANVTGVNFASAGIPAAQVSPTSLAFGNQQVGVGSASRTVTLTNSGTASLTITGISFSGTNATDFTQTSTCGTSLAAGTNCAIKVVFTPAANGARTANLLVADNAAGSPQSVSLSGTGISPTVQLSPTSINFGIVLDFTTSSSSSVTVRNTGNATLTFGSIRVTGANASDFFISSSSCGSTLAAGSSCTENVRFNPQAAGTRTATLTFTDNAPNSPQGVSLTGTGTMVRTTPSSLSFGRQTVGTTSGTQNVTMTNVGQGTLTVSAITITGTNPGDFSQTNNCGTALASGRSCTIGVRFRPTAIGSRGATLRVDDSDPTSPELVSLSGTGR